MSLLGTYLHHPRKLGLRRALFQIHLWMGVLLSLYLILIALSGAVLVFRTELIKTQLPKHITAFNPSQTAPIATVLARFNNSYPQGKIETLQMPSEPMPVFVLAATESPGHPIRLVADPVTAAISSQPRTWLDWVYDLHVYLLLGQTYGMQVNAIGALCLLILTGTGLFLWWPGLAIWARGLRVSFRHNWRRINFDLHSAIGFWTLLIVFSWALSGVYFGWYRQVSAIVSFVSPLRGMISPSIPTNANPGPQRASLDQVLNTIHQASPSGRLFSLSDPSLSTPLIYALVDLRAPGDFSHRDIITISTSNAHVVTIWHYGQNQSAGDWILWSTYPVHFGTLWGRTIKILWATLGLALAALTITGLLMYWNRYLRHQVARSTHHRSGV